jgi:hypothetical protein
MTVSVRYLGCLTGTAMMARAMTSDVILWRRLDRIGCESARLLTLGEFFRLEGTAVFLEAESPCRLDYSVICDRDWTTLRGEVSGWVGGEEVEIRIERDADGRFRLNGNERPEVEGCADLDLNFSPSTNLLPIRRLGLQVGEEGGVTAAWLRFPSFDLVPLAQTYRRLGPSTYFYASEGGFTAELEVNASGLVVSYPGFCRSEPSSEEKGAAK